jgi:hypothetical protein
MKSTLEERKEKMRKIVLLALQKYVREVWYFHPSRGYNVDQEKYMNIKLKKYLQFNQTEI